MSKLDKSRFKILSVTKQLVYFFLVKRGNKAEITAKDTACQSGLTRQNQYQSRRTTSRLHLDHRIYATDYSTSTVTCPWKQCYASSRRDRAGSRDAPRSWYVLAVQCLVWIPNKSRNPSHLETSSRWTLRDSKHQRS